MRWKVTLEVRTPGAIGEFWQLSFDLAADDRDGASKAAMTAAHAKPYETRNVVRVVTDDGFLTKSGRVLEWKGWHNFGGPCSYRVTGPRRTVYAIRLDASGEIVRPAGPAARDALLMALYLECRAASYERYAFGSSVIAAAEETTI